MRFWKEGSFMNFVFISPNYPEHYWMFCRGLKKYGATVLAIVDQPYDSLSNDLKANVDECYVVDNFYDYEAILKACGYFTFKYGKIDWIESNNEAWMQLDARLRDDFHVTTGFDFKTITEYQSKAAMKKYYEKAGLKTARYALVHSLQDAIDFVDEVGYPVVLKPDHGVGASFTYQIDGIHELKKIYAMTKQYQMIIGTERKPYGNQKRTAAYDQKIRIDEKTDPAIKQRFQWKLARYRIDERIRHRQKHVL